MNNASRRERRSPDLHSTEQLPPKEHLFSSRERRSPDLHSSGPQQPEKGTASGISASEWHSRGYLRHRDGYSLTQHVSGHLADSLPKSAIEKIDLSIKNLPESKRRMERRKKLEAWIDAGHGSCILRKPEIASMVQDSLMHFHDQRYYPYAWVVMPNHFHALFQPINDWTMAKIVGSWKKFMARRIRDYLKNADQEICAPGSTPGSGGRRGPVWHHEFWDRYIRDEEHYLDTVEYIHNNPVKGGLVRYPEEWPWSSAALDDTGYGH
ncbi:MAG: transposase [Acidobacteriota bacterium]